jgi:hypothetical protein
MMKAQLMVGMALSIVLAGSLMPMARATDSVPTPTVLTVQEKGNHQADKAESDKMAAKAVQLISEETHQPIANTSAWVVITCNRPEPGCENNQNDLWERVEKYQTSKSGIIMIWRKSNVRNLKIYSTEHGNLRNSVDFGPKAFFGQPRVFKVKLSPSSSSR